jgi:hypothetical protein
MLGPLMKGMSEGSFGLASCWIFDGPVSVAPHGSHLDSLVAFLWVSLSSLFGVLSSWTTILEPFLGSLCAFVLEPLDCLGWVSAGSHATSLGSLGDFRKLFCQYFGSFLGLAIGILNEIYRPQQKKET